MLQTIHTGYAVRNHMDFSSTAIKSCMNIYVIVPHPDDEVLMCGGTIAKHVRQGDRVVVCHAKAPEGIREAIQHRDCIKAQKVLGYHQRDRLEVRNEVFANNFNALKIAVEAYIIKQPQIDILYTVAGSDNHQDHQALFKALSVACRPIQARAPITTIYTGETLSSSDQPLIRSDVFDTYNILTQADIDKKVDAIKCFTQEYVAQDHPRSEKAIKALAVVRGASIRQKYAEVFRTCRCIIK